MTKEFFQDIEGRLNIKLTPTVKLTTLLTGHGNIKAYLQGFHISEEQTCPCGVGDQITDHKIYEFARRKEERDKLMREVNKKEDWTISKRNILNRHHKGFPKFIKSISFEELNVKFNQ
jgi:hypothetical protein